MSDPLLVRTVDPPKAPKSRSNRVHSLDAARTAAVLLVFCFHYWVCFWPVWGDHPGASLVYAGPFGTNLLLVISGYFAYLSLSRRNDIGEFLLRRFFRLQIPLVVILACYFVIFMIVPERSRLSGNVEQSAVTLLLNMLLLGGVTTTPLITVTWTISYIFLFTVVYAISYRVLRLRLSRWVIFAGYVAAFVALSYSPLSRMQYMLVGALMAHFGLIWQPALIRGMQVTAAVALILFTTTFGWDVGVMWATTLSLFLLYLYPPTFLRPLVNHPAMGFLGSRSYSFYLVHSLVLHFSREVLIRIGLYNPGTGFWALIPCIFLGVFAAWLFDRVVDRKVANDPLAVPRFVWSLVLGIRSRFIQIPGGSWKIVN